MVRVVETEGGRGRGGGWRRGVEGGRGGGRSSMMLYPHCTHCILTVSLEREAEGGGWRWWKAEGGGGGGWRCILTVSSLYPHCILTVSLQREVSAEAKKEGKEEEK